MGLAHAAALAPATLGACCSAGRLWRGRRLAEALATVVMLAVMAGMSVGALGVGRAGATGWPGGVLGQVGGLLAAAVVVTVAGTCRDRARPPSRGRRAARAAGGPSGPASPRAAGTGAADASCRAMRVHLVTGLAVMALVCVATGGMSGMASVGGHASGHLAGHASGHLAATMPMATAGTPFAATPAGVGRLGPVVLLATLAFVVGSAVLAHRAARRRARAEAVEAGAMGAACLLMAVGLMA